MSEATVVVSRQGLHALLAGLVCHLPASPSDGDLRCGRGMIRLTVACGQMLGLAVSKDATRAVATRTPVLEAATDDGVLLDGAGFGDLWLTRASLGSLVETLAVSQAREVEVEHHADQWMLEVRETGLMFPQRLMAGCAREPRSSSRIDAARVLLMAASSRVCAVASQVIDADDFRAFTRTADAHGDTAVMKVAGGYVVWGHSRADRRDPDSEGSTWMGCSAPYVRWADQDEVLDRVAYAGEFTHPLAYVLLPPIDDSEPEIDEGIEADFVRRVEEYVASVADVDGRDLAGPAASAGESDD